MSILGDVSINNKWYRINIESYRNRDIIDFSPRAASPGGGMVMSDLMLYQPLMQTDWRHGFGFPSFDDASGYFYSTGNVDTRHEGMAMMFTNKVSSDTSDSRKLGAVMHNTIPYFYGPHGIRKYANEGWEDVVADDNEESTLLMLSLGEKLFAAPHRSRIRMSGESGKLKIQKDEKNTKDIFMRADHPTTNYNDKATLRVGTISEGNHMTSYLLFDMDKVPDGAIATKATLVLQVLDKTTTVPDIHIARCLRAVKEKKATWNEYDTSLSWATAGGTGSGDISTTDMFAGPVTADERDPFTIELDVDEFNLMLADNKGMIIYEEYAGTEIQNVKFSGSGDANESWRPELIIKYTLVGDWENTGQSSESKNYHWACMYNGFTYLGVLNTNRVHYTSDPELADIEATDNDPSAIKIGSKTTPTVGAINFLGSMYVAKSEGLWQVGEDKIARKILDFTTEIHESNFNSMTIHNGYLIFPVRDTLYQWNGHRLNTITPNRISETFPYRTYGAFKNLITIGDFMYCTARTNDETYSEALLCYDGVGWHKLMDLITDGLGSISLLFFDTTNNYLWIHYDYDEPVTYYIPFQQLSVFPYASFPITGTHSLYSCVHDMGFSRITKSSPSLLLEGSNLSTAHYLSLYFKRDTDNTWIPWGQMIRDGIKEFTLPAGLHTVEYRTIQIRIDFTTTDATNSPILNGATLRFLMRPSVAFGWNFDIVAADHFVYGEREDTRTAAVIISDLKEARDSKAPVPFIDVEGNSYYVYISAMSSTAQERNVDEQNGSLASIESVVNINLVEAK